MSLQAAAPALPAASPAPGGPRAGWLLRRLVLVLLGLAVVAFAGTTVYQRSFAQGESNLKAATNSRLELFASVVEARVRRLGGQHSWQATQGGGTVLSVAVPLQEQSANINAT